MWGSLFRRFSDVHGITRSETDPTFNRTDHALSPRRPRSVSPALPPPLDPVQLHGFHGSTPETSRLLTGSLAEEIRLLIPERLQLTEDWTLVYSLDQDGASLSTLYQAARLYERKRTGFVLVVRDTDGGTFGAYLSEYPHPAPNYFGNGECFLWRLGRPSPAPKATLATPLTPPPHHHPARQPTPPPPSEAPLIAIDSPIGSPTDDDFSAFVAPPAPAPPEMLSTSTTSPSDMSTRVDVPTIVGGSDSRGTNTAGGGGGQGARFQAYLYSGINDFCINCETRFLSVGGGGAGRYGLWLDDALDRGHSGPCETFGNEALSEQGRKFSVLGVELWVIGHH